MKINDINLNTTLTTESASERLDVALARSFPDYSRSRLQQWVKAGYVQVNDQVIKDIRSKVIGGEQVIINATLEAETDWSPEAMPIDVIYEDNDIMVINKAADVVVHPAAGNYQGTLVNGLLHLRPELETIPRAGIVHRLDKDTTGLMVVAKTLAAHHALVDQLKDHSVARHYECLVYGQIISGGTVAQPIGRNPRNRKTMAVVASGKEAVTHYRVKQRYRDFTLLDVSLETGRTHQIRVHMSYLKHPLVGDSTYGGRLRLPKASSEALISELSGFKRQALHARELGLNHPVSGKFMSWQVDRPADFQQLVDCLEGEANQHDV
jgi:23S rRNA pseudouridine1911/1915/1917 synthase